MVPKGKAQALISVKTSNLSFLALLFGRIAVLAGSKMMLVAIQRKDGGAISKI